MFHRVISIILVIPYFFLLLGWVIQLYKDDSKGSWITELITIAILLGIGALLEKYYNWAKGKIIMEQHLRQESIPMTAQDLGQSDSKRLRKLDKLYEKGLITTEERDAKRQEILDEL